MPWWYSRGKAALTNHPLCGPKVVTKISELEIDADKDWQVKGISELKEFALGMQRGDILVHGGTTLIKVSPSDIGDELTSGGSGHIVSWKAPPGGP